LAVDSGVFLDPDSLALKGVPKGPFTPWSTVSRLEDFPSLLEIAEELAIRLEPGDELLFLFLLSTGGDDIILLFT
jgi:hypothetical protein